MSLVQYLTGSVSLLVWLGLLAFTAHRLVGRLVGKGPGYPVLLATLMLAVGLAIWTAVLPGLVGLLSPLAILLVTGLVALSVGLLVSPATDSTEVGDPSSSGEADRPVGPDRVAGLIALVVGSLAGAVFGLRTLERVDTGMTGFDSTWYHGPIAAEFIESGSVFSLHTIAPQFLTWFYPHNSEVLHASAGALFGGDLPSLALGLLWFGGSLLAGWVIGDGRSAAPLSMIGVALAIGSFAFSDQAGEARNDLAGTFFLLGGIGIALASFRPSTKAGWGIRGPVFLVALAAGLAVGTKLNFVLPGLVLALGAPFLAGRSDRGRAAVPALAGLVAGGSFWYLRNLVQSGNPLPWVAEVGPFSLPGPDQERGGRDPGSVLDYLDDPGVIVDPLIPGLWEGLGDAWPLLLVLALLGLGLSFRRPFDRPLVLGSVTGIAVLLAWVVGPTSASGPEGDPVGFVSGLRYLVPGLAIGLALLGPALAGIPGLPRSTIRVATLLLLIMAPFTLFDGLSASPSTVIAVALFTGILAIAFLIVRLLGSRTRRSTAVAAGSVAVVLLIGLGFLVERRYDANRYASPEFVTAGLAASFAWAQGVEGDSIGTTVTRSYPFYGRRFDNRVAFIGVEQPNGGFVRPEGCREFVDAVNRGRFEWVVASLDREGVKRDFPPEVRWLDRDPAAVPLFRNPPTAVFAIEGRLDPGLCPDA